MAIETHTEQLRRHLAAITPNDMGLMPTYILTHLVYLSERIDQLEQASAKRATAGVGTTRRRWWPF